MSATDWTAVAAGDRLVDRGVFDDADRVVLVDPAAANHETDLLRVELVDSPGFEPGAFPVPGG